VAYLASPRVSSYPGYLTVHSSTVSLLVMTDIEKARQAWGPNCDGKIYPSLTVNPHVKDQQ